jgi:hypothetical protein
VLHGHPIDREGRGAEVFRIADKRFLERFEDGTFEAGDDALAVGLAERHQPHRGRYQIGAEGIEIGVERGPQRYAGNGGAEQRRVDPAGTEGEAPPIQVFRLGASLTTPASMAYSSPCE